MLQLGFSNICGFNMKSSLVESCLFLLLHIPLLLIFGNLVPFVWCGSPGFPSRANLLQLGQGKPHLANLWAALMGPRGTPSGASSRMQCPWHKPPGEAGAAFGKNLRMSGGMGNRKAQDISGVEKLSPPQLPLFCLSRSLNKCPCIIRSEICTNKFVWRVFLSCV